MNADECKYLKYSLSLLPLQWMLLLYRFLPVHISAKLQFIKISSLVSLWAVSVFHAIIGWLVGAKVEHYIGDYDHWVAFVILAAVGGKMLFEAITNNEPLVNKDISRGWSLVSLALATSIDANAVGISFGIIDHAIIIPAIVIGVVASAMSLIGIKFGEKLSEFFGRKVEIVGGIILILIGVEIVIEHLTA